MPLDMPLRTLRIDTMVTVVDAQMLLDDDGSGERLCARGQNAGEDDLAREREGLHRPPVGRRRLTPPGTLPRASC